MKLNSKLIRRRLPTMRRVAVFAVLTFALAGAVAVAGSSQRNQNGGQNDGEHSGYIDSVEGQLAEYERTLDELRRGDRQYDSIDSYMLADDLELAMRDLRGDLLKLGATQSVQVAKLKQTIELKLHELKYGMAQLNVPGVEQQARLAE